MRRAVRPLLLAAVLFTVAGCTMCPDPFDYSGPVPNGSVPQNDFCARSNGILPRNATPSPWPPLVDGDEGGAGSGPVVAEYAEPVVVAEHVDEVTLPDTATAEYPPQ
jgi:hypothetical protein